MSIKLQKVVFKQMSHKNVLIEVTSEQQLRAKTAPDSFRRWRLRLHGDLLLGPPVVQPDGHRVRHDDVIRLRRRRCRCRRRCHGRSLLGRRPRRKSLGRDHHRVAGGDRREGDAGEVVLADSGSEVDALVLRRGRQDEAAVVRPAAAVFPGERLRLGSVSIERGKAYYYN